MLLLRAAAQLRFTAWHFVLPAARYEGEEANSDASPSVNLTRCWKNIRGDGDSVLDENV